MKNNRFYILLYVSICLVIVVSSSSININDNHNSRNDTDHPWYRTRVILRSVLNTFDTNKRVNRDLDVTFGRSMKEWLYTHDATVNSSCTFSKTFGRLCYIYHCDNGKTLYCESKLRTGPCPESLKTYENSFHCRDIKTTRAKGKVHVCKLGGMVRSLGERSKLRNGKTACMYRDVMSLSGSIVEELTRRVDGKPWLLRKRRYFRRQSEDKAEADQQEDDNFENDTDEEDVKMENTRKNSEDNNDSSNGDKDTAGDNIEDDTDTSNSKGTTATSNVDEEDPTEETLDGTTKNDVTEQLDDDVKNTSADVMDETVTTPEEEKMTTTSEEEGMTKSSVEEEIMTKSSVEEEIMTKSSVEEEIKTTTSKNGRQETTTSKEKKMTTSSKEKNGATTPKTNKVMATPEERNEGDNHVNDGNLSERKKVYDVLNKLFREHSDFFTFQIERQIEKRIKEGKISELLRLKLKTLTKNKSMRREAVMGNLKSELRELLYCTKMKTVVQDMLNNLGRDLKIGKNGKLFR